MSYAVLKEVVTGAIVAIGPEKNVPHSAKITINGKVRVAKRRFVLDDPDEATKLDFTALEAWAQSNT